MKKQIVKRPLLLDRQTIRVLDEREIERVAGASRKAGGTSTIEFLSNTCPSTVP